MKILHMIVTQWIISYTSSKFVKNTTSKYAKPFVQHERYLLSGCTVEISLFYIRSVLMEKTIKHAQPSVKDMWYLLL